MNKKIGKYCEIKMVKLKEYKFGITAESLHTFIHPSKGVSSINIEITGKGFQAKSLDSTHSMCVDSALPHTTFTTYPQVPLDPPIAFTIDSLYLIPWLAKQKGPTTLNIRVNQDRGDVVQLIFTIASKSGLTKERVFSIPDTNKFPPDIKTKFISEFTLPPSSIKEILKEIKDANSFIRFTMSATELVIQDDNSIRLTLSKMPGLILTHNEPTPQVTTHMTKAFIVGIFTALPITPVTIKYQHNCPFIISYTQDKISHKILLAPRVMPE